MEKQVLDYAFIFFGMDPEAFLLKDGRVIGAEKVIPKKGVISDYGCGRIVRDGVQIEFNTTAHTCRANLANELSGAFRTLRQVLRREGVKLSLDTLVTVGKKEFDSLSPESKQLGCMPSFNAYKKGPSPIKVNPQIYRKRSAGGHLHLGIDKSFHDPEILKRLVKVMDVLIGNTCVMLDRDPLAAERRKVYGKAGEYRTPRYGVEYRVLSNFWLRSYPLMSLVTGLSRLAVNIMNHTLSPEKEGCRWDAESTFMKDVDLKKVRKAINKNDLALAMENWLPAKAFIDKHVQQVTGVGLSSEALPTFEYFVQKINEEKEGIKFWFPEDPLEHWSNLLEGHGNGWESFLENSVCNRHLEEKRKATATVVDIQEVAARINAGTGVGDPNDARTIPIVGPEIA